MERDICSIGPQHAGIIQVAVNNQSAATRRFKHSGIDDSAQASIDVERVDASSDDRALVDKYHHAIAEVPGAGDDVVHVRELDVPNRSGDHVFTAVGEVDVAAALQGDAVLDQFQVRLASSRVQFDRPGIVDDA